jgi:hypothetical protein
MRTISLAQLLTAGNLSNNVMILLALLPALALLVDGSPIVGSQSYDVYPPTKTSAPNTAVFPNESEVGYYGTTITGAEPM